MASDTDFVPTPFSATEQYRLARDAFSTRSIPECLELLQAAEQSGYNANECAACRWDCFMLLGRFAEAWRESERITERGGADPHRLWDELPFTGKRVIIRCLHGF